MMLTPNTLLTRILNYRVCMLHLEMRKKRWIFKKRWMAVDLANLEIYQIGFQLVFVKLSARCCASATITIVGFQEAPVGQRDAPVM